MVKKKESKNLINAPVTKPEEDNPSFKDYSEQLESRDEELCTDKDVRETCLELYSKVLEQFDNQSDRSDNNMDYWDIYNCVLNANQFYMGNTRAYVPIVHDAVNARVTRFSNQIFPSNKRYIEVISNTNEVPNGIMALMEHYIRKSRVRTEVVPALIRSGDVEGQYTVYVSWENIKRTVVSRVKKPVMLGGDEDLPDPDNEVDDIEETEVVDQYPKVMIISDNDFCVSPATSDNMYEALQAGGFVAVLWRWSKAKIQQMISDGEIEEAEGKKFLLGFEGGEKDPSTASKDIAKDLVDAAGIKKGARGKYAQVYEVYVYLTRETGRAGDPEDKDKQTRRLYRVLMGGSDVLLSVKRNPFWSDRLPIISCPVEKVHGSFKGRSKVAPCADFQYIANDAVAEGMDSAAFSMLPIVMTDPEKNPRIGSMILSLSAIWQTSPKDTQFAQFPKLYEQAFEIIAAARTQIFQTLSVNPAMITQNAQSKKKPNQAEVSQEQAIDLLTTADAVTILEEGILTPMLTLFMELDHQYRDKALSVRAYGPMGARANYESVPPIAMDNHYSLRWFGVEQARNQAAIQAQISALNVLRGIPPQLYQPYRANYAPVLLQLVENVFGPRLAPQVFEDLREQMGLPVEQENLMLADGVPLHPHPMDNHQKHIQQHYMEMQAKGDPHGTFHAHIAEHNMLMQQMQQQKMQEAQGVPGAPGGAGKGLPGSGARGGAMLQGPKGGGQRPNGMMHADRMGGADPSAAPRR